MARDIRQSLRQVLDNDSARMIAATAAAELIRRAPVPRKKAETRVPVLSNGDEGLSPPMLSGIGGFATGVGAAIAVRGVGKLVRKARPRALFSDVPKKAAAGTRRAVGPPLEAVDAFASRLGGRGGARGSGEGSRSASQPTSSSRPRSTASGRANRGTGSKRTTSAKRTPTAKRTATPKRSATAKRATGATAKRASTTKRTTTTKRTGSASAKRSATGGASANGGSARPTPKNGQSARKPART